MTFAEVSYFQRYSIYKKDTYPGRHLQFLMMKKIGLSEVQAPVEATQVTTVINKISLEITYFCVRHYIFYENSKDFNAFLTNNTWCGTLIYMKV